MVCKNRLASSKCRQILLLRSRNLQCKSVQQTKFLSASTVKVFLRGKNRLVKKLGLKLGWALTCMAVGQRESLERK